MGRVVHGFVDSESSEPAFIGGGDAPAQPVARLWPRPRSLALFMLLFALTVGPAEAEDAPIDPTADARAREIFRNGQALFEEGRYEDAIVAWKEAWLLSGRPQLLFNVASAQERLGLWRETLDTLNHYRAFARPEEREALERRIRNLERSLEEQEAAISARQNAGRASNHQGTRHADAADPSRGPGWGGVALLSVGAAGLTTGTLFAIRASGARADVREQCVDGASGLLCPSTADEALQNDRTSSLVADLGFAVGAAAIAGGVVLVALDAPGGLRWRLAPNQLTVSGSFR